MANPTSQPITVDPRALLVPRSAQHEPRTPSNQAGRSTTTTSSLPTASARRTPGPVRVPLPPPAASTPHFEHMRAFWNQQLSAITQLSLPSPALVDAYKSGFITTQITRSANHLDTGINGYEGEYSHDVIGILTNLFTQGSFADAHALLIDARSAVGTQASYVDGLWTYPLPWAVYLLKTGDVSFVRRNFDTSGPAGAAAEPSLEDAAHAIAADRTGPMGTMEATQDIDTQGTWTVDDYEALLGLAAYHYIACASASTRRRPGPPAVLEPAGRHQRRAAGTIAANHLDYLPCSLVQPNTANRCSNPMDANWTSPSALARGRGKRACWGPRSAAPA